MAEDWLADVRKYVADADEKVVATIVRYCGIALQKRDSSLVSFSDAKETDRVRENYLKKKLALTHDDATLDAGIASVGERMQADRTKNRVTVYYLLAEHFDMLPVFGGAARGAGAGALAAGAAGLAALTPAAASVSESDAPAPAVAAPPPPAAPAARPQAAYATAGAATAPYHPGRGALLWLLGGILLAAFIAMAYAASRNRAAPMADGVAQKVVPETVAPVIAAPAPPAPQGAGVIAAERDAKPMLTVYFDTGKAAVTDEFAAAAAPVKAYLDANPGATLAVSGFNDPTGNAAANAELSKNRAKNVKAALEALGVPAEKAMLEKPAETTGTGATNTESRRVEVVIKD